MLLYIDSDRDYGTGWQGYDYLANLEVVSETATTLWTRQGGGWIKTAGLAFRQAGNQLELAIPRDLIGQASQVDFAFKWADNIGVLDDVESFFVTGDTAPDRRFNYRYRNLTCADLLEQTDGRYVNPWLAGDIGGPDGLPDCRVNLHDFWTIAAYWPDASAAGPGRGYGLSDLAALAGDWMMTNDPLAGP